MNIDGAREAIAATYEAADGDSNDTEIEALQECRDLLEQYIREDVRLTEMLADATRLLDAYDNAYPAQDYATLAEVSAAGPIVEALRALIEVLS